MIRRNGMSLVEVTIATAILVLGLTGLLSGLQRANDYGAEAELRAQQEILAESALQHAMGMSLGGNNGLYAACESPKNGLIVHPEDLGSGPFPPGLVAVIRCKGNKNLVTDITAPYEVDLVAAGLPPTTTRMVRIHVQAFVAVNPDETDADLLEPRTGPGLPPAYDLVGYRVAK